MTIATIQFMSDTLWREVTYAALVPDRKAVRPGPYPVLYQLHGGNQSYTSFTAYEDFLMQELADHVKHNFPVIDGKWAIGGNSMGGFAAVRLGIKYPQRFFSVWSHSGGFPDSMNIPKHWYWSGNVRDLDCFSLVEQLNPTSMPHLSFDCGIGDHLLADNRRFNAFLKSQGVPHTYKEHPGGHDWEYWNAHVQEALQQHLDEFKRLYE